MAPTFFRKWRSTISTISFDEYQTTYDLLFPCAYLLIWFFKCTYKWNKKRTCS